MTNPKVYRPEVRDRTLIAAAFLGVTATGFFGFGALATAQSDFATAFCSLAIALVLSFVAYRWPDVSPGLKQTLAASVDRAATSPSCWTALILAVGGSMLLSALFHESAGLGKLPKAMDTDAIRPANFAMRELTWQSDWARDRLKEFAASPSTGVKRSESEVQELIVKSDLLLQITRKGVPIFQEWQSLLTTNPEKVCLGLDLTSLSSTSARLAAELHQAQREQQKFFDDNARYSADLLPLVNNGKVPASSNEVVEFEVAAASLDRYTQWLRGLSNHPTCDNVVQTGELAIQSLNVNQALWRLGFWLGLSQNGIDEFQRSLRPAFASSP